MSWQKVKLKDICDLQNGYAFKSSDYVDSSKTLSCRMSNIRPGGVFNLDYSARYLPDEFAEKYSQFLLKDGDVIIAMTDLADAPKILGVPTVVKTEGRNVLLNQRVGKLVIKDLQRVHFPYLKLALNFPKVRSVYKKFAGGGLQINLGKNDLLSVEIPLPPLDEQKRIAAILDKADAIHRKRQQAIDLADDFLRSVFLDMFGDPAINPNAYDETTLGQLKVEKMNNGIFKKNGEYGGNTPVAWVSELFRGRKVSFRPDCNCLSPTDKEIEKYGLRFGDLLFCRSSLKLEGIGFNNVYLGRDNEALFECHLIRLRPDLQKIDPVFLNYQLRMPNIRKRVFQQSKTVTMTTIDQEGLSNVKVVVPPLDEQKKFMELVKSTELIVNKAKNTVSFNNDSFNSLSQKAFAGDL